MTEPLKQPTASEMIRDEHPGGFYWVLSGLIVFGWCALAFLYWNMLT